MIKYLQSKRKTYILVETQNPRRNGYLEESAFKAMTKSFSVLIGKTVSNRVSVAAKKERSVAPLQCNGKSLEELLRLQVRCDALPRRAVGGDRLQSLDGRGVPATECLHDEGLEEKPSISAIDGVFPHLLIFPHLDSGSSVGGGPIDDRVLGW